MSESQGDARERGREVWIEKYRPQSLDDVVGQEAIVGRLRSYIEKDDLPHLLFSGPAGVGKCVTGETPILTDRGVERIEDVVGEADGFATPRDGLRVLSFGEGSGFEYVEPSHVFGKQADDLVQVTTRDGGATTVTPEHRLLVVDHGGFRWTTAENLEPGDRIARPLEAPLPASEGELDWLGEMDGERTFVHVTESFAREHGISAEENYVGKKRTVVSGLRRGDSVEEIAERAATTHNTVLTYQRRTAEIDFDEPSTVCSLSYLRSLDASREELRANVTHVQYVTRSNRRSAPVTPPWNLTSELAEFVGLAVSEARLDGGQIKFYNTDDELLERFGTTARDVFGVEVRRGEQQGVPYREIGTRTLTHLLESCFAVFDGATGGAGIGSALARSGEACRAAFLRAVFDAEAHVTEHGIVELTQKNERLITLVSYLLAGFGVPSRRKTVSKAATNGTGEQYEYHTLYVSGASSLTRFEEQVGFTLPTKAERLARNAAREPNPNNDTVPTQTAVDTLCERLYLKKGDLLTPSLDPESPGRENYQRDVNRVIQAAVAKLETAQRALERLDTLAPQLDAVTAVPAHWIGKRAELEPLSIRRSVSETVGVRSDRLLEYSDGQRTPGAGRTVSIMETLGGNDETVPIEETQTVLRETIEQLAIPYEHVAEGLGMRSTSLISLLNGGNDLRSLARYSAVADRIRAVAAEMLSTEVLEALQTLDTLVSGGLYFDTVERVESVDGLQRVYDLTVPGKRNYVAGRVPTVMHNTTSAVAIAKTIYGDDWRSNFLELNASDERGIDVVRDRIKNFARASFGGHDYRIIFLDEADALTSDAQSALRRTMEQFSNNTRFILSCNYSSQIIDPIQSRCAVFRFSPLPDEAIEEQVRIIAEAEGIEMTDEGVDALVYAAAGDMRKAINGLQAASVMGGVVDEEAVYAITSTARPEQIREMVELALDGDFAQARSHLERLLTEDGIAGSDVIDQLHRSVWEFGLSDRDAVRVMERIGEADYRITLGASERVQLEALLASLTLDRDEQ